MIFICKKKKMVGKSRILEVIYLEFSFENEDQNF